MVFKVKGLELELLIGLQKLQFKHWRYVNDDYQRTPWGRKQRSRNVKCDKENFAVRQHLSEASGEQGAIQKQPKMTKRRVKRWKQISAKCKTLFAKDLTEFIEKLKQQFPNLKYS